MKALDRGQTPYVATPDTNDELGYVEIDGDGVARDRRTTLAGLAAGIAEVVAEDPALRSRYGPLPSGTAVVGQVPVVTAASPLTLGYANRTPVLDGMKFTGATGNYVNCSSAPLGASCTVLDVYARVAATDWTPSGNQYIASCGISQSPNVSWGLSLRAGGNLGLLVSPDGTAGTLTPTLSTMTTPDDTMIWVWARCEVNVAGSMIVTYKKATDAVELPAAASFSLVEAPLSTTAATAVQSTSATVEIGSISSGASANFNGTIARVIVDANGVRKMNWRGDVNGYPRMTDSCGVLWTPTGSAWSYKQGTT